jgi:hypothetical protein
LFFEVRVALCVEGGRTKNLKLEYLEGNDVGDAGARALAKSLKTANTTLASLDLACAFCVVKMVEQTVTTP